MRWLLVAAVAALCASLAAGSAPGQTSRLAQGLEVTFESDRNGTSDVWEQDENGPNCTQICDPNIEEAQPSQVPGRATTYTSQRDGDFDIYALTQNGTVQVTDHSRPDYAPATSPDGNHVAFVSERDGNKNVYVASVEPGASLERLTSSPLADTDPAWSPAGDAIALASARTGKSHIWLVDGDGSRQLTFGNSNDFEPAFSPDGAKVAFTRRHRSGNYDIFIVEVTGQGLTRLTASPAEDSEPAWSPQGNRIAFVSARTVDYEIWLMNADGSGETNLSASPQSIELSPSFQDEGSALQPLAKPDTTLGGVTCGPRSGTARGETIRGSRSADVICGRGGNDTILGRGGNDIIDGGPGKDTIKGGAGRDRIISRDGKKDSLFGGPQSDRARTDGTPPDTRASIEAQL